MRFFTPILLLIASIGLFFFFIDPHYKNISTLRAQAQAYDDAISRAQGVVAKRDQLLAKKNSFSPDDIAKLQKLLPDAIDPIALVIDINTVASHYHTTIKDIKIGTDTTQPAATVGGDQKAYGSELMNFSISLPYDQFQQFLKDLEKSLQLVDITGVTFTPSDQSSTYTYNIAFRTYWLK